MRTILVTGAAGFIGYHLTQRLLAAGDRVVGIDNLNSYYSVQLKKDRLQRLTQSDRFVFDSVDVADSNRFKGCSRPIRLIESSIWQPRQVFAIPWRMPEPTSTPISSVWGTSSRLVAMLVFNIWFTLAVVASTEPIPNNLFRSTTPWIIPSASMRRRRSPMN